MILFICLFLHWIYVLLILFLPPLSGFTCFLKHFVTLERKVLIAHSFTLWMQRCSNKGSQNIPIHCNAPMVNKQMFVNMVYECNAWYMMNILWEELICTRLQSSWREGRKTKLSQSVLQCRGLRTVDVHLYPSYNWGSHICKLQNKMAKRSSLVSCTWLNNKKVKKKRENGVWNLLTTTESRMWNIANTVHNV